jgi:formylglycine-generating enzyme required for sulfatase activity
MQQGTGLDSTSEGIAMSGRSCRFALVALLTLGTACQKVDRAAPATDVAMSSTIVVTDSGIEMVMIPAGQFCMGSDGSAPEQGPAHNVEVDAFLIDRFEVTQAIYARLDPINGSHFKGPELPTEMISWGKAALYCNLRSAAEGLQPCYDDAGACDFEASGYRLPTEAEWEYACRAGSDATLSSGTAPRDLEQYAWFADNANQKTHAVGRKKPNAWGLFDMHGNVAEWCNDFYDAEYYMKSPTKNPRGPAEGDTNVLRGGHWGASALSCSSAFRVGEEPGFSDACFARDAIGFRCVRRAPVAAPGGDHRDSLGDSVSTPPRNPTE